LSDPLLADKTRVPPPRSRVVLRPHLIGLLNEGIAPNNRLILISAPAGYGKSTLLGEWVSQLKIPVAWLSLEEADSTPLRFWTYFVAALQTIPSLSQAGLGGSILHELRAPHPEMGISSLSALVNELDGLEEPVVLVLDDLHTINNPEIHEGLAFVIEHLPASAKRLQLVVAGRTDPPWPLARIRANAHITELRSRDLRFTMEEATAFLNQVMGLRLSVQDVSFLDQRTEGWVAGLQMAALSMQNREDIQAFLERFSASHRYIMDYLIEEVLSLQPARVLEFLLKTSILDRLTAPLCDAVTGSHDSQELLSQLERSNVFLSCLDDEQRWYRYHPLFVDLLGKRLAASRAGEIPELRRLAGEWYEANGFLREAILQALGAQDMKGVARLVSENVLVLAEERGLPGLLDHVPRVQPEDIVARPWLCIAVAWAKAYAGQLDEADELVNQLEASAERQLPENERPHLIGHALTIRAYIQWIRGRAELAVDIARRALTKIPSDDALETANILIILGLALQNSSRIPEAIQAFRDAISFSTESGNHYLRVYASGCLVFTLMLAGHLREAYQVSEQTIRMAERDPAASEPSALAVGLAARSEVLREWDELDRALRDAQHAVSLAEKWRQADTLHYSLSVLADAYLARGELEAAGETIDRSKRVASGVSSWFLQISERQEARLSLTRGDLDSAVQWKDMVMASATPQYSASPLLARILMAQDRPAEALQFLEAGILRLEQAGIWGALLELHALKAMALSVLGKTDAAMSELGTALEMAEPEGYVRRLVCQGRPVESLLDLAIRRGIRPDFARRLLDIMVPGTARVEQGGAGESARIPQPEMGLIEPLSDRECDVLRLLNSSLSVPEIAEQLTVAPSTVRTHVRAIYGKLGVHGRLEAIEKARGLNLI
jgi:LuxR family maltose regulon positive regulatory protein